MLRITASRLIALALFLSLTATQGADNVSTSNSGAVITKLDSLEFTNGPEVKGATGTLTPAVEGHSGHGTAAWRLTGDFSKGGAYVGMKQVLHVQPRKLQFWVKAEGITALQVKFTDATKQTFLYELPLAAGGNWQHLDLTPDTTKLSERTGGIGGGRWEGVAKDVTLMLPAKACTAGTSGSCIIDDGEIISDPWAKPRPMPENVKISQDSIFGFSSHMIHTDLFFPYYGPYNRMEYILPLIAGGDFGVVREALYQGKFADDRKGTIPPAEQQTEKARAAKRPAARAIVEDYLGQYQHAGVRPVVCAMFTLNDRPGFDEFFTWIGNMASRFPLQAVEMHNEPHLKHFGGWKGHDYAVACKAAIRIIKQKSPNTPVLVGSLSHLWWQPGIDFLQTALKEGLLDVADGISVHPYRMKSAPEGGAIHEPADSPVGLEREIREFWALVQGYNAKNRPLGLYFTEYGYSSGTKGGLIAGQSEGAANVDRQADYLTRSMFLFFDVRLRGIPIEGIYWYDLKCDGADSVDLEHNFGVVSYDTTTLRPGYVAYSEIARAFGHTADWEAVDMPVSSSAQEKAVKSFAWRRISDGALILSFWRMNQLQTADQDFQAKLSWPLPEGFTPGPITLHDLHGKPSQPLSMDAAQGRISADLNVSARAAWIEVMPSQPQGMQVTGNWLHTLPAAFTTPAGARVQIDAPRHVSANSVFDLTVNIDNRAGKKPFSGVLRWMGKDTPLNAVAGASATLRLHSSPSPDSPLVGNYLVMEGNAVVGRGDYMLLVEGSDVTAPQPSASQKR